MCHIFSYDRIVDVCSIKILLSLPALLIWLALAAQVQQESRSTCGSVCEYHQAEENWLCVFGKTAAAAGMGWLWNFITPGLNKSVVFSTCGLKNNYLREMVSHVSYFLTWTV